ncbi:MAG: pilus assembly protein N-terminal domain-containing protein [Pseudomonadota bacterium]
MKRLTMSAFVLALATPALAEMPSFLRITESDGILLPTDAHIGSVLVADPEVANVQPVSDRTLFLFGKSVGATTLFVLDDAEQVLLQRRVVVTRSLEGLHARVDGTVPPPGDQ